MSVRQFPIFLHPSPLVTNIVIIIIILLLTARNTRLFVILNITEFGPIEGLVVYWWCRRKTKPLHISLTYYWSKLDQYLNIFIVIVSSDKASNNFTLVSKKYYVSILIEELGLNSLPGNPTYHLTDFSVSEVLDNHKSILTSFGIDQNEDELDLPYIRCIKIHLNIDSLLLQPSAPSSLYPFFLPNCLHILSKVFRSTAKQPILEVGWIRCGSSKIQRSNWNILNHRISTI